MPTKTWTWSAVKRAVEGCFVPGERRAMIDAYNTTADLVTRGKQLASTLRAVEVGEWRQVALPEISPPLLVRLRVMAGRMGSVSTVLEMRGEGWTGAVSGALYEAIARQLNQALAAKPRENPAGPMERREREVKAAIVASLDPWDAGLALRPEYRAKHALGCDPTTGFCSIAAEAAWAMLGGRAAGYELVQVKHEGGPHWFVRFMPTGRIIDPTRAQFSTKPPYELGRAQSTGARHGTGYQHLGRRDLLVSQRAHRLIDLATARLDDFTRRRRV